MKTNELFSKDRGIGRQTRHVTSAHVDGPEKPADAKRLRCADVARNRAFRYAKQHRIAKPLWPLIATAMLIGLVFERRSLPSFHWKENRAVSGDDSGCERLSGQTLDHNEHDLVAQPSKHFLARDVAQSIAFLIRNRGRQDNNAVRTKWKAIDTFSLPLAIYLREIEAFGTWDELQFEVSTVMLEPSARLSKGMSRSLRHEKIVALLPEWQRRGEKLLSTIDGAGGADGNLPPDAAPDEPDGSRDDDDKPPVP